MPMIPSVLAVAVYATVKVVGYSAFGRGGQRFTSQPVKAHKFGLTKTGIGLVGGVPHLLVLIPLLQLPSHDTAFLFISAIPIRLAAWALTIGIFFGYRHRPGLKVLAVGLGVVWSYVLDFLMAGLYRILPGMEMPLC